MSTGILLGIFSCGENRDFKTEKAAVGIEFKLPAAEQVDGEVFKIDLQKSGISWKATKMAGTRSHEGTLALKAGYLVFKNGSLAGGEIIAAMNTIGITDIPPHEKEAIKNLTNHLKSDFETKKYPFAVFKISGVEYQTNGRLMITGTMTIKNITKALTLIAVEKDQSFSAKLTLDRFSWNIGIDGSWLEKRLVDKDFNLGIRLATENNPSLQ